MLNRKIRALAFEPLLDALPTPFVDDETQRLAGFFFYHSVSKEFSKSLPRWTMAAYLTLPISLVGMVEKNNLWFFAGLIPTLIILGLAVKKAYSNYLKWRDRVIEASITVNENTVIDHRNSQFRILVLALNTLSWEDRQEFRSDYMAAVEAHEMLRYGESDEATRFIYDTIEKVTTAQHEETTV